MCAYTMCYSSNNYYLINYQINIQQVPENCKIKVLSYISALLVCFSVSAQ